MIENLKKDTTGNTLHRGKLYKVILIKINPFCDHLNNKNHILVIIKIGLGLNFAAVEWSLLFIHTLIINSKLLGKSKLPSVFYQHLHQHPGDKSEIVEN